MADSKERLQENPIRQETPPQLVDVDKILKEPVPREIHTWLEKIEEDQEKQQIQQNNNGQVVIQSLTAQTPKIVLPVSKNVFLGGFKKSVSDAGRWLSIFLLRLIKIKKGNVQFKQE